MRKSRVLLRYNRTDVTDTITDLLESFDWTDVASGEADTISLVLNDRNMMWVKKGFIPIAKDYIKVWIRVNNWMYDGDIRKTYCGKFQVDSFTATGFPNIFTIEGICLPINKSFNVTQRNKTFKKTSVKRLLQDIAKRAGMNLVYDAPDHKINEISQSGQTDMAFAFSVCNEYGVSMKVYNGKLVAYDQTRYEKRKDRYTIKRSDLGEGNAYNIQRNITTMYDGVKMQYSNKDKKTVTYKYVMPKKKGKRLLVISGSADSHADAEKKAKAQLLKALREVQSITLTVMGDPKYKACDNFSLEGFGRLNGKYFIDKVVHSKSGGYLCTITAHKVVTQIG